MIKINSSTIKSLRKTLLPDGYQQLEYVESNNIPRVDLGVYGANLGGTFSVATTFQIYQTITASGNTYIMGSGSTATGRCLNVAVNPSGDMIFVGNEYGGSSARTITLTSSDVNFYNKNSYVFRCREGDRNQLQVNGTTFTAAGNCSNSATGVMRLFNGLDSEKIPYLRLFAFKMFNSNGEVILNLIPAKRLSDNTIGLYDTANDSFLTNSESGSSLVGGSNSAERDKIIKVIKNNDIVYYDLPYGYTQLSYARSTSEGGQWIDTGVSGNNNNLKIKIRYSWSVLPASGYYMYIMGSYIGENSNTTRILQYGDYTTYLNLNTPGTGGTSAYNSTRVANTIYEETFTKNLYTSNGNEFEITATASGSANNLTMYLFHAHKQSSQETGASRNLTIYSCSIYDGDTLIRKFVPCTNAGGIVGMFDIVEGKFHPNIGTGSFIGGSVVHILPGAYQEVEYIESTGSQYIDTGLRLNQDSRVKIKYQYKSDTATARVFGDARSTSTLTNGWILTTGDGTINGKIQTLYGSAWQPASTDPGTITPSTNIVEYERNGIYQYVNGSLYFTNSPTTFETTNTMNMFGAYFNTLSLAKVRIYSVEIWKNGIDKDREFIPCYRKSDNVVGMYDTQNGVFYTNQGTGNFIAGGSIVATRSLPQGDSNTKGGTDSISIVKGSTPEEMLKEEKENITKGRSNDELSEGEFINYEVISSDEINERNNYE